MSMRLSVDQWPVADLHARLAASDAVVLTVSLAATDEQIERALDLLSSDERVRYAAYTNAIVARRFARGRHILRDVVGTAVSMAPGDVPLREGLHGKPYVAHRSGRPLWFSLAHSEDFAVIALSRVAEVGVDLERSRAVEQWQRVADRVLDRQERMQLDVAVGAGDEPGSAFLRHWCRVEAELKAIGCGIAGLEAHRAGVRPRGLRLADLTALPVPAEVAVDGVRYQAAVALCSPSVDSARQITPVAAQAAIPTSKPAIASTR